MEGIFFNRIEIENFRCFDKKTIHLNTPDGVTKGSGLTILIGENGNGKTTVLESVNYLTQSTYSSENKLKINDFRDYKSDIVINGFTNDFNCKMSLPFRGFFESNGIQFKGKSRISKSRGKLLSSPFQINSNFICVNDTYKKEDGSDSGKEIPSLFKIFSNSTITGTGVNVFYFDKNRSRQINSGSYKTTFDRICDDLNWKFLKNIEDVDVESIVNNICGEYFQHVKNVTQKGTGEKLSNELCDFFDDEDYKNLKIELLDLLHPFTNSFFSLRKETELQQIKTKDFGSGVEIILTFLLLNNISKESKGGIIYLIDEPELHLHPKGQDKLIEILMKESVDKQIIISTHSPYLFKNCLTNNIGLQLFNRIENGEIDIVNVSGSDWGVLPWSPSWGEINYFSYDLPTIEFHNELYGFIQEFSGNFREVDIENYLENNSVTKIKEWIRSKNGSPIDPYPITLCTYVRNSVHHPENTYNENFTDDELRSSTKILIDLIKKEKPKT